MKIVFISNFFNHHQHFLSESFHALLGNDYCFIETSEMTKDRKELGWGTEGLPPYVLPASKNRIEKEEQIYLINEADAVIFGSAPDNLLNERHRKRKLVFRYSERMYKRGDPPRWQMPLRFVKNYWRFGRHANDYLLCASAYASRDYAMTRSFVDKAYKWGYFPESIEYDPELLMQRKSLNDRPMIVWAGRLIEWKHPETAILTAEELKRRGYSFSLKIIGCGELEPELKKMAEKSGLSNYVEFLGAMPPQKVRHYMEAADIFLFTSDFNEGWGAVLNEAMNSGCAVVASHAVGSVPFMLENKVNGLIYENGDTAGLIEKTAFLLDNTEVRRKLGYSAYTSVQKLWNPQIAADRFIELASWHLDSSARFERYTDGPCSIAERLENEWFRENGV